jgi:peptidoglycan/xylan/chitin deacetylase (PgdA/CDA1 family)
MIGKFIVSLDCEGKWGMADAIGPQHDFITEISLKKAYIDLLQALKSYDMKATFAFVGAFTLTNQERMEYADMFLDTLYQGNNWIRNFRKAQLQGLFEGWFCPEAYEIVKNAGHEIASHGFSHIPFDDPNTPKSALEADLVAAVTIAQRKGIQLETFIYPRNRIGHLNLLRAHGFRGYRESIPEVNKIASISRELNIFENAQPQGTGSEDMVAIPAGYFLNWRVGLRRRIPKAITIARWRSILNSASDTGRVAHLWLHPHNIISGPETFDVFQEILSYAAKLRDAGKLVVSTQIDYVNAQDGGVVA